MPPPTDQPRPTTISPPKIYSTENVQIIRDGVALEGFYDTLNDAFTDAEAGDTLKLVAPSGEVSMTKTSPLAVTRPST